MGFKNDLGMSANKGTCIHCSSHRKHPEVRRAAAHLQHVLHPAPPPQVLQQCAIACLAQGVNASPAGTDIAAIHTWLCLTKGCVGLTKGQYSS
jgi:hypothetical protein